MKLYDIVVVGAGPAGMSASLNAENDGLEFKLVESEDAGWFPRVSVDSHYFVDNYLGFSNVSGTELIRKFAEHLRTKGIFSEKAKVETIERVGTDFFIHSDTSDYMSRSIILATGTRQKELVVPGIERFLGNSVFYYCVPDGDRFVGKKVLVVGGRNTGAVTALYLNKLGCAVEVVERDPQLNAKNKYASRIIEGGIPFRVGTEIVMLKGGKKLEGATLKTPHGLEEIAADGVFVCIGLEPKNSLAKNLGVSLNDWGYINVDKNMATSVQGIFAAGDITGGLKQIAVAVAQGSIAAYNLSKYLSVKNG